MMALRFLPVISLLFGLLTVCSLSAGTIRSSVAPEFRYGLHEKYLQYLADKLDMSLIVYPVPFARRVDMLRDGEIDLMVGLKSSHQELGEFVFLQPSYESLYGGYYILSKNRDRLKSIGDLTSLIIGTTIDDKHNVPDPIHDMLTIVPVSTLKQKIHLLLRERIDAFGHFTGSANQMIEQMGVGDRIVLADYQRENSIDYYYALSLKSPLMKLKPEIEQIIKQGVENGDFQAIRQNHYKKH